MKRCDTIVIGDSLIGGNGKIWSNGAGVAVCGGIIVDMGEAREIIAQWQAEQTYHLGCVLLMPGLINAHTHVPMTMMRGFADDLPLLEWLNKHIFPVEAKLTRDLVALGARLGMYEMMRTGTTSFVDSYLLEEAVLETAETMGMRCTGGEVVFAFPSPAYADWSEAEALYRRHAERFPVGGRVQVAMMPHSVYTTNDALLKACRNLADELGLMLHIHLAESIAESNQSRELHSGMRPVPYAHAMGLLAPSSVLAHAVDLDDSDIELIAQTGAQVVHNPVSNLKLASGVARVKEMASAGISISLGTDGACSNNTLDMFETMKLAAILAKGASGVATCVSAGEALAMATSEGARIFRTPGLGELNVGAPADLIALDLSEPNMIPMFNPVSHAVYAASGKDCVMTMVDGKVLFNAQQGGFQDGQYDDTRLAMADMVDWVRQKAREA